MQTTTQTLAPEIPPELYLETTHYTNEPSEVLYPEDLYTASPSKSKVDATLPTILLSGQTEQRDSKDVDQTPPPPLPERLHHRYSDDASVNSPIHYARDPKRLTAYLIPFPKPKIPDVDPESIPQRYLIYTPPPPPFMDAPKEGEKEAKFHKVQRKWLEEVRDAKNNEAKTASWKGMKSKAVRGINWGMGATKNSNIEFLNRIGGDSEQSGTQSDNSNPGGAKAKKSVQLEEMALVYPASTAGTPDQIREEFINTMLRSKTKAERDAVIATGLLPISFAFDVLITVIWPFGGALEIDAVWAYASIRGAKASRSLTKRLDSKTSQDKLNLNFHASPRLEVLERYLAARCHDRAADLFPYVAAPTETEVLEAIEWFPSSKGGLERNWEDEQWEISEVKEDVRSVNGKAAREWVKWVRLFEKTPEKAMKK